MLEISQLPYKDFLEICKILDVSNGWRDLAGSDTSGIFSNNDIDRFGLARHRQFGSPTNELLRAWANVCWTVDKLYNCLMEIKEFRAAKVIEHHVLSGQGQQVFYHSSGGGGNTSSSGASNFSDNDLPLPGDGISENGGVESFAANAGVASGGPQEGMWVSEDGSLPDSAMSYEDDVRDYKYSELEQATDSFSQRKLLGEGGFGEVYMGLLNNKPCAIKILRRLDVHDKDFTRELQSLSRCCHPNIVRLLGYSSDSPHKCLVLQYMSKGSLRSALDRKSDALSWQTRHKIISDAARGLYYLHNLSPKPIIHADIKSANILLSSNYEARLCDFGLAREAKSGEGSKITHYSVYSKMYGTLPYLPSDFINSKKYPIHTDVYGFGVVLFEVCTGEPPEIPASEKLTNNSRKGCPFLKDYIHNLYEKNYELIAKGQICDPNAMNWPINLWNNVIDLGQRCTADKKRDRPCIKEVARELEQLCVNEGLVSDAGRYSLTGNTELYTDEHLVGAWGGIKPLGYPSKGPKHSDELGKLSECSEVSMNWDGGRFRDTRTMLEEPKIDSIFGSLAEKAKEVKQLPEVCNFDLMAEAKKKHAVYEDSSLPFEDDYFSKHSEPKQTGDIKQSSAISLASTGVNRPQALGYGNTSRSQITTDELYTKSDVTAKSKNASTGTNSGLISPPKSGGNTSLEQMRLATDVSSQRFTGGRQPQESTDVLTCGPTDDIQARLTDRRLYDISDMRLNGCDSKAASNDYISRNFPQASGQSKTLYSMEVRRDLDNQTSSTKLAGKLISRSDDWIESNPNYRTQDTSFSEGRLSPTVRSSGMSDSVPKLSAERDSTVAAATCVGGDKDQNTNKLEYKVSGTPPVSDLRSISSQPTEQLDLYSSGGNSGLSS